MAKRAYLLLLIFFVGKIFANGFYDGHAEGWHWYIDPKIQHELKKKKDPIEQMNALRFTIKRALDNAILNPTDENVKNYIALQNQLSDKASAFANTWQKVLLENPELNYSLVHPTNNIASQIDIDLRHQKEDLAIAKLATESGLFFFYKSTCPYCQRFAPTVKDFAERYKIAVIPITLDGIALPEFPESKLDNGQAAKFHVTVEPSLFAVNPYTKKAYPIAYGMISEESLRQRILDIANNFQGGI
jgi:conjugal transfer pilus assembly protein TraF